MKFQKEYPLEKLTPWEENPRQNDASIQKLVQAIGTFGFVNPIIADKDGIIRAGHARYKAAKKIGLKVVPVLFADFQNEKVAKAYAISDNKTAESSGWDLPQLKSILEELSQFDIDLSMTAFEQHEIDNLVKEVDVESFFEEDNGKTSGKGKEAKTFICPNCGVQFEI